MSPHDPLHRAIRYLRISVTDRCNLRCRYCMPEEGVAPLRHDDILRLEEIARVARVAAGLGISRVRLTGGEPLVRKGILDLVRMIAATDGIEDLSMTTNATLLAEMAQPLAEAGLRRVNVSLDTLRPDRFREITRWGSLEDALAGIAAAHRAGLEPVKINTVVMRGFNDDEVVDLAARTLTEGWHVRFIEVMPLGENAWLNHERYVPSDETRARIVAALGPLELAELDGNGPARYWRLPGAPGTIGLISALSQHFCATCNRLRLTSDGRLMPCLFSALEYDLRTPRRTGADDAALRAVLLDAIAHKPVGHTLTDPCAQQFGSPREMSRVGG
ncbi:MAG: GTP 3',8-cyclase MoaA [Chloroflexota bacterium]